MQVADARRVRPDRVRDGERLLPGEGIIDLDGFFGALSEIGYDGAVSPEVFGRGLAALGSRRGAELGLRATREAMSAAFAPAGARLAT